MKAQVQAQLIDLHENPFWHTIAEVSGVISISFANEGIYDKDLHYTYAVIWEGDESQEDEAKEAIWAAIQQHGLRYGDGEVIYIKNRGWAVLDCWKEEDVNN